MDIKLNEKFQTLALSTLGRINFISWATLAIGIGMIVVAGLLFSTPSDDLDFQMRILIFFFAGIAVGVIGTWMIRWVRALTRSSFDLSAVEKALTPLTMSAMFISAIIAIPLFYLAPILGIVVAFVFATLLIDIVRLRMLAWRTRHNSKKIVSDTKTVFQKVLKSMLWPGLFIGTFWLIIALGPLWIIAIILFLILFVLLIR